MRCYKAANALANWIWCTFFEKKRCHLWLFGRDPSASSAGNRILNVALKLFTWVGQQRWSFTSKKVAIFCFLTVGSCQGGARRRMPRSERQASSLGTLQDETFSFGPGCLVLCLLWSVLQFSLWDGDRSSAWSSTDLGRRGPLLSVSDLSQLFLCTARSRLFLSLVLFHPRLHE